MKKISTFLVVFLVVHGVLCSMQSSAQAPQAIPYQAVARDASGNLIANHPIDLRFSIIDSVITGPVIYQEIHHVITNDLGLFTLTIFQANTQTTGPFDPSKWDRLAKFIKVEMDADGNGVYTDMGTQQMLSVPFALYANVAGTSGSVTYKGTWNAQTNEPHLESSVGSKGDFYVVINASPDTSLNTELNGNRKYLIGDAVIYNQGVYMRFKTSDDPVTGGDVTFTPGTSMTSTNVQDAIDELDAKWQVIKTQGSVVYSGTWDVQTNSPPLTDGVGTKGFYYVVSNAGSRSLGGNSDWNVGDWAIYNGTGWEKVDNTEAPVEASGVSFTANGDISSTNVQDAIDEASTETATQLSSKVNKAGDTMTGNLILNADPTTALGATTKQYADAINSALQANVNTKVSKAGDTMTGALILNADPTTALGAATKQYVDDHSSSVIPNGTAIGQTLHWDGSAWVADSGIYSNGKRFGIGDSQPDYPLVVKAESSSPIFLKARRNQEQDTQDIAFSVGTSHPDSAGFSILTKTSAGFSTRLFIQDSTGNVGIGTNHPTELLQLQSHFAEDRKLLGLKVYNETVVYNRGWSFGHLHDDTQALRDGAFSFFENGDIPTQQDERVVILPGGNVGINESMPSTKLHVSCPLSDPNTELSLMENTGILNLGPITDNLVADYRGIQARTGSYDPGGLTLSASTLNLQRLGGDILIHGGSSIPDARKFIIKNNGSIGIGTLMPSEKLHIEDASSGGIVGLKILNTATTANQGWTVGHLSDNTGSGTDGAFVVKPTFTPGGGGIFTILPNGKVGINEVLPYATLHVSRPVADPLSTVDLAANTGIFVVGPITDNIVADYRGIQARSGSYGTTGLSLSASTLNLQRLGGDILVHGNSAVADSRIFTIKDDGKVGIGTLTPSSSLHIQDQSSATGDKTTVLIDNSCITIGSTVYTRVGLQVSCTGVWNSNPAAKNIGLHIASVSGQSSANSNIAALINGNVVVGELISSQMIGTNGRNVLAIQNGQPPVSSISSDLGTAGGGVQLYSHSNSLGVSTFNVMNGDGTIIQLYRAPALTPANTSTVSSTYGSDAAAVINNMRDRINQLETKLQVLGLLN